ncbi:MAG: potassium-transporting ATPase subunit KdpA, partial [Acidobacteriaceae bacterium]|nr:potassium-transporting ATPase subunit KdpA [Acidobacteriaceae bacterium]
MTANGWIQIAIFFGIIFLCTKPLGLYMEAVSEGRRTWFTPALSWLERLVYRVCGVDEKHEQKWTEYAGALLAFSLFSALVLYALQRLQGFLPFNPQHYGAGSVSPDLAFNTAISFTTNTNWQSYTPETTLSYLVQMFGLTMHNFASAAA